MQESKMENLKNRSSSCTNLPN